LNKKDSSKRPDIEIMPFNGELNPNITKISNDTVYFCIKFRNFGSATENDIHYKYILLVKNKDWISYLGKKEIEKINSFLPATPGLWVIAEHYYVKKLLSNDTLYFAINFTYKDLAGKCYGPITQMFYWSAPYINSRAYTVASSDYEEIIKMAVEQKDWPKHCF
jgi:hypothetical protein